eukprot:4817701-Prymnesium_polylepis.1
MACGRTEGAETVWDLPGDPTVSTRAQSTDIRCEGAKEGCIDYVLMALGLGTLRLHTKRRRMVRIEDYNCKRLGV